MAFYVFVDGFNPHVVETRRYGNELFLAHYDAHGVVAMAEAITVADIVNDSRFIPVGERLEQQLDADASLALEEAINAGATSA